MMNKAFIWPGPRGMRRWSMSDLAERTSSDAEVWWRSERPRGRKLVPICIALSVGKS